MTSTTLDSPSAAAAPRMAPNWAFAAVCIIFIFSGASALIYEVVWTRQLTTFFGSTLYGVATVLSAFMGGLALGSYLIGKRADTLRSPLAVYGILEIGIGLAALIFPWALRATQPIIGSFYVTGGENTFLLFSLVRFVIVFVLLMIPTTLMGATLPVLSKAVTPSLKMLGRRVGALYALNTAGAVLGVFCAGFIFLENFGVFYTTLIAVAADVLIGVICITMGRNMFLVDPETRTHEDRQEIEATEKPEEEYSPRVLKIVLLSYLASGFIALAYQVCWTRALIFSFDTLKSTTYSFSGMLMVFLLGLAAGSALMQAIVDKQRDLLRLYALIQMGIGLGGAFSFFMLLQDLPALEELYPDGQLIYWNAVANVMWKTAAAIGIPTFLMGMAFPVVTKIVVGSVKNLGIDVARVYALNTVGAILGSFSAGFILIPALGITGSLAVLVSSNLLLAVLLFQVNQQLPKQMRLVYVITCIVAAGIASMRIASSDAQLQRIQPNETVVHYEEGAMATISVVENNLGDRMIYVDDVGVAGTDKIMLTDQKSLAHVPMMLLGGDAQNVLSVGFGSGGASFSYTLYPHIENIHTIEIAPEVLRAAPVLTDSNHGVIVPDSVIADARRAGAENIRGFRHPLDDYTHTPVPGFKSFDPRFKVLMDDARAYLRFSDVTYDVIATDCTDLRYKSNANLYDLEYFKLCRERISDDGLVVVWMPLGGLSDRAFRSALRTFQVVFPEMTVWYFTNQPTHYCLLIATKGPLKVDWDEVVSATAMDVVQADLNEIGLRDPAKLISCFTNDERSLEEHLDGFPLNTEDHPIIEFESPRYGYDSRPLRDNQMRLYEVQDPVADIVTSLPDGMAEHLWELQQANYIIFKGHSAYRLYDFRQACAYYMEALKMVPDDVSIERLLEFPELRTHYETTKSQPTGNTLAIGQALAEVFLMQDRLREAVTYANETTQMLPILPTSEPLPDEIKKVGFGLYAVLAKAYAMNGTEGKARSAIEQAARWSINDADTAELTAEVEKKLAAAATSG